MTEPRAFGFEKDDAQRLLRIARQDERATRWSVSNVPGRYPWSYVCKTGSAGVPARNGNTPGTATVDVYRVAAGGSTLEGAGFAVTAYNLAAEAVGENKWIMVLQDLFGQHWVVWEECE